MKIGDKLWLRSDNHRSYDEDRRMIPEKTFREHEIIGETSKSWILKGDIKLPKNAKLPYSVSERGFTYGAIYNDEMKQEWLWDKESRFKLVEKIKTAPTDVLKQVDALLKSIRDSNNGK